MRIPEAWLREWIETPLSIEALADVLTMAGLEVEEIERGAPPFTGVVLGHILSAQKHPDADRLRVCEVSIGLASPLQIVCGAPNARAGLMVACATEGAVLPGGFEIRQAKMRGVVSQGMLCSAKELGISEASGDSGGLGGSDGILEVAAPVEALGQDIRETLRLDEAILILKPTPNRGDCLSMLGVARELSALLGVPLRRPTWACPAAGHARQASVERHADAATLCGRFSSQLILGVRPSASKTPDWMIKRLIQSGQRPISPLVDISNYVMLELGQPSHVFDLDALVGCADTPTLQVRWAAPGETCELLNGQTVILDPSVGVIADAHGPVAMAGIMGGARTAVSDQTQNILLEAAFWWPDAIRGRAQRYKFATDAGHRFERGVDPAGAAVHLERISSLIIEVCGGSAGPVVDQVFELPARDPVSMRRSRCERIIGRPYSVNEIAGVFTGLGLSFAHTPSATDDLFKVTPPSHRFDLSIEEDLIEEVARIIGFEAIPSRPPVAALKMVSRPEASRSAMAMRDRMVGLGFQEVLTYGFLDTEAAAMFAHHDQHLALQNPIASHLSTMRPSVVPNLLKVLADNLAHREARIKVFELGRVFRKAAGQQAGPWSVAGVSQPLMLSGLVWGPAALEHWEGKGRSVDFYDLKQDLLRLAAPLHLSTVVPQQHILGLHPGRSAQVLLNGKAIGWIGETHPSVQAAFDLPSSPIVFEIELDGLLHLNLPSAQTPSRFPSVSRDLAFVLPKAVAAGEVLDQLETIKKDAQMAGRLVSIQLFDQYRGPGLDADEKSLAFRFVLQDTEKTLEDAEVDACLKMLSTAVVAAFSAKIRS